MVEITEAIRIQLQFEADRAEKQSKRMDRQLAALERRFDPLARATQKFDRGLKVLEKSLESGAIDQARYERNLSSLQAELDRAGGGAQNLAVTSQGLTSVMGANRAIFQQVGYQVGDFAVQVQGGTSALTAFTQQGSQLLGVFGAYGAIAGAALAVGAPIISTFLNSGQAAETFGDALEDLSESLDAYRNAAQLAGLSTDALVEKYGQGAETLRGSLQILRDLAEVNSLDALGATADLLVEDFGEISSALERLSILQLQGGEGGRSWRIEIGNLRNEYGLTVEQAERLRDAVDALGAAEGTAQTVAAAEALRVLLLETYGTVEAMPDLFRTMAEAVANVQVEAFELNETVDSTTVSLRDAAQATYLIADGLSNAAPAADALLGRIQSVASAAWNAAAALVANQEALNGGIQEELNQDARAEAYRQYGRSRSSAPSSPVTRTPQASSRRRGSGGGGVSAGQRAAQRKHNEGLREAERIIESLMTPFDRYLRAMEDAKELHEEGLLPLDAYNQHVAKLSEELKDAQFSDLRDDIDSFTDALFEGKDGIRGFVQTALTEFAKLQTSNALKALFGIGGQQAGGGSFLGSLFAGFFDQGGNIPSGKIGIAGENGPEFIRGPAHVTSTADTARMMRGSAQPISITIDVAGANGDRAIEAAVSRGVTRGMNQVRQEVPGIITQHNKVYG